MAPRVRPPPSPQHRAVACDVAGARPWRAAFRGSGSVVFAAITRALATVRSLVPERSATILRVLMGDALGNVAESVLPGAVFPFA